uniref:Pentacotripeptide-repeat region of PRORP domain-containing protein n=1 Tax=Manihot esculenta TaxID=3983 RepID=A0A2C9UPL7_MANES
MCSQGHQPDRISFSILLDGLCKQGNLDEALALFKAMEKSRLKPNHVTYTILIDGLCRVGNLNDAKKFFSRLLEKGVQPNVYTYSTFIKGLCKEGLLDEAYQVFRGMEDSGCLPNDCWFLRHEDVPKASQLIDEMVDKGFSADTTTTELVIHLSHNDGLILRNYEIDLKVLMA